MPNRGVSKPAKETLSPRDAIPALTRERHSIQSARLTMIHLSTRSAQPRALLVVILLTILAVVPYSAQAGTPPLLDDFDDSSRNKLGVERLLIDDKAAGSQSNATKQCADGILTVEGELVPGRGVPAFISLVSLLSPEGKPQDLSNYDGVRLRVKVHKGILTVQVGSSEITNFDYHTSRPIAGKRGEFQEVRMPFKEMRRAWSEQIPLNVKVITSVNLVSFGMARGEIAYAVDEIGFY